MYTSITSQWRVLPVVRGREDSDALASMSDLVAILFHFMTTNDQIWAGGREGGRDRGGGGRVGSRDRGRNTTTCW